MVGLQAELALKRRHDGTLDADFSWEAGATELGVDEELAVKEFRSRVEGRARDGRVNVVLCSDGVAMYDGASARISAYKNSKLRTQSRTRRPRARRNLQHRGNERGHHRFDLRDGLERGHR